jgi:hypothetical protein
MARSQTWTRNIGKKQKKSDANLQRRGVVDDGALENLKRRAEEFGLIVHARSPGQSKAGGERKTRGGK